MAVGLVCVVSASSLYLPRTKDTHTHSPLLHLPLSTGSKILPPRQEQGGHSNLEQKGGGREGQLLNEMKGKDDRMGDIARASVVARMTTVTTSELLVLSQLPHLSEHTHTHTHIQDS